jgi:hypothetical protein
VLHEVTWWAGSGNGPGSGPMHGLSSFRDGVETIIDDLLGTYRPPMITIDDEDRLLIAFETWGSEFGTVYQLEQGALELVDDKIRTAVERIAVGPANVPYVLLPADDCCFTVRKREGDAWASIHPAADNPWARQEPGELAVSAEGHVYVTLEDGLNTLLRHAGSGWESLGSWPSVAAPSPAHLQLAADGTPHLAFLDGGARFVIARRQGEWIQIGSALGSGEAQTFPDFYGLVESLPAGGLAIANDGTLYTTYCDGTRSFVARWTGVEWRTLGDGFSGCLLPQIAVSPAGDVYAAHAGSDAATTIYRFSPS